MAVGYVDIYFLPIPEDNLDEYTRQASLFGQVAKEYGALSYREFRSDDLSGGLTVEAGEVLTSAVAEFRSRAHRDEVMEKVMQDSRVVESTEREPVTDMSKMRYGGFETFVDP
jgi:uncharacterized protein YbaA (DUF1428 family)